MDVGERAALLPHLDHLDRHRLVPESAREQPLAGVARRRLLLHGHRGFQGHLPEILSDHADHLRPRLVLGPAVRGDSAQLPRSTGSSLGGRHGGRLFALQRDEVTADDHAAAPAESRLGEDRAYLQVH